MPEHSIKAHTDCIPNSSVFIKMSGTDMLGHPHKATSAISIANEYFALFKAMQLALRLEVQASMALAR